MTTTRPVVVVGVDDSATSRRALVWALAVARRLGAVVEAVTTYETSGGETTRELARTLQESVIGEVLGEAADGALTRHLLPGNPVDVLALMSGQAYLLVLGRHSTAGLRHSADSSTAEQVARLADCPVVIVPGAPTLPGLRSSGGRRPHAPHTSQNQQHR